MKILVVEDETAIADFVQRGLEAEGYAVDCAGDGLDGERQAIEGKPDLVVLDLMLPGRDGISVLGKIRETKPTLPVIVLTARDAVEDKVAGLDGGATDYVTKPFSFDELTARIRAHLRDPGQQREATVIDAAGIHVDLLTREVTLGEEDVHLSAREFDLLDRELRADADAFGRAGVPAGSPSPAVVEHAARLYIATQPFRASSRLLVVTLPGRRPISNEPELLSPTRPGAQVAVRREARELAETRSGYSSVTLAELGEIRLYREPVTRAGHAVAFVGVGEPLTPVTRAEKQVARTFLL